MNLTVPENWTIVPIKSVIEKIPLTGRKLKRKSYIEKGLLPVVDQGQNFIGGYTNNDKLKIECKSPIIVFGDHTKVIKYVDFDFVAGADGVKVIRPLRVFYPKLFYYFLQLVRIPEKGYARHFQYLEKSSIPLPPLPEQHRIVAKIEEFFTKLDAGIEALKKTKAQLKRYRQAVLKYAFEGKLTAEWREKHKDEVKSTTQVIEKIRNGTKLQSGRKFKHLPQLDNSELQELPNEWERTRIGNISDAIQYGTSEKATGDETGIPVVRMGNIQHGKLIFENLKYFPKNWSELNDYILQDGDVLFNRTNSAELVGKTAVYKMHHPKAVFASYLIRIKVNRMLYNSDLLSSFINSVYGRSYISSVVSQQVGQANVNGTKLSFMSIPLPSISEQHKIAEEIERRFSKADEIEKTVDQSLKQAKRLRQSILKNAFEGKLVPQDPNDEPAEKLLERIKLEKAKWHNDKNNCLKKMKMKRKK